MKLWRRLWRRKEPVNSIPEILLRYRNRESGNELTVRLHITDIPYAQDGVFVHHFTNVAREFAEAVVSEEIRYANEPNGL